jgi:hypothetical protein
LSPELELAIFVSLILGVDKVSTRAQTNPQALNSFSKCKVAMLKSKYQEGNDTKQSSVHDKLKAARKPIGLGVGATKQGLELSTFLNPKLPMEVTLGF